MWYMCSQGILGARDTPGSSNAQARLEEERRRLEVELQQRLEQERKELERRRQEETVVKSNKNSVRAFNMALMLVTDNL